MRAIAALTILTACAPDLTRSAGSLDVQALGVSRRGDRLEVSVFAGEARYTTSVELATSGARVHVDSVPEGAVGVTARLLSGGSEVATREGGGVVRPGVSTLVVVDFGGGAVGLDGGVGGDGGPGAVESPPLVAYIRGIHGSNVREDELEVKGRLDREQIEQFTGAAGLALDAADLSLGVAEVEVELLTAVSTRVARLSDLFHESLRVELDDKRSEGPNLAAAEGPVPEAVSAIFAGRGGSIPASAGEEFDLDVKLEGRSEQPSSGDFSADLAVRVTLRAVRR